MAVILCSAAAIAVLWAAASPQAPHPSPAPAEAVPPTQAERLADEVSRQADRLRAHLRAAPAPRPSARNPFRFAELPSPPAPRPEQPTAARPTTVVPLQPAVAPLRLIGVAERATSDGLARTAIMSDGARLFMVTAGDAVTPRYIVTAVGPDAVELRDTQTDAIRRLGLP